MRKIVVLIASISLVVLLASGVALAINQVDCSDNPDALCLGTPLNDEIKGTGSRDNILARAGNDVVNAGNGNDLVYGHRGADRLLAGHCYRDQMFGGSGDDTINVSDICFFPPVVGGPGPESVGDEVECGLGFDVVRGVDRYDRIAADCERIVTVS